MLEWHDDNSGSVFGIPMRVVRSNFTEAKTTANEIVVLKWRNFFDDYRALLPSPPKRILELGFFEGGSTFVLAAMFPDAEIIAVDLRGPNSWVEHQARKAGLMDRVRFHYRVSQNDREKLTAIAGDFRPDLIIDDASHRYQLSKDAFDITFPWLVPGGAYIVEDWGWAHVKAWKHFTVFADEAALSNLTWELTMATATSPEIIDRVHVNGRMTKAFKSDKCPPLGADFRLNSIYTARGSNLTTLI